MNSAVKITGETTHFVLHLPNQRSLVIILLNIIPVVFFTKSVHISDIVLELPSTLFLISSLSIILHIYTEI